MRLFAICLVLTAAAHAAGLEFPTKMKELDVPPDAKVVVSDFEFANNSGKPVTIRKYDSNCSCQAVTVKDGKLRYGPGETGVIRATFDMGNFSGDIDKTVAIYLDDDREGKPSVMLTTRVKIPVLVETDPRTLTWALGGKPEPQSIHIRMSHSKPIKVTGVQSSNPVFSWDLKTHKEGEKYELVVTPTDVGTPTLAILRIETDCDIPKHRTQQVFAVVRKPAPGDAGGKP